MSQTVNFLRTFNRWRRGDETLEQPSPRVVGEMIDAACDEIEKLRAETIVEELDNEYLRGLLDEWRECAAGLASALHQMRDIPDYAEFALAQFYRLKEAQ
jgi:hypothetical protein